MEVLLLVVMGAMNIACFFLGAKVGQTVAKGETIEAPSLNPMKAVEEKRNKKQADEEQARIDTILRNVERYDGTGRGQEDVPRG